MAIGLPLLAVGCVLIAWYGKAFGELPDDELRGYPLYFPAVSGLLVIYDGRRKWSAARSAASYLASDVSRNRTDAHA